jgi:hypothetical protein
VIKSGFLIYLQNSTDQQHLGKKPSMSPGRRGTGEGTRKKKKKDREKREPVSKMKDSELRWMEVLGH